MEKKPQLTKLLSKDYTLFISLIIAIVNLGFSGYFYFMESSVTLAIILIGMSLLGFLFFIYRLRFLWSLFRDGVEVDAIIKKIKFYKDRGTIQFTYRYEGRDYASSSVIIKNEQTSSLTKGMSLTLLINKHNNKKYIIKDLYV